MFPSVQYSKRLVGANSETSAHSNTQLNLRMKSEIPHLLQLTFHRMMIDRCSGGKFWRIPKPDIECEQVRPENMKISEMGKSYRMDFEQGGNSKKTAWF